MGKRLDWPIKSWPIYNGWTEGRIGCTPASKKLEASTQMLPRLSRGRIFAPINGLKNGLHSRQDTKMPPRTCRGGNRVLMSLLGALLSKFTYKENKTKEAFKESVKKSLHWENVITTECVRAFSRRARQYTMAYFALSQEAEQEAAQNGWGQLMQKNWANEKKNAIVAPSTLTVDSLELS
jgi:hypothetical protein